MQNKITLFILKIFLVLLPFISLFIWIEYQARKLPNSYALKKQNFERLHDSIRVLVLGSSHALKGINPDYFSCCAFNFSNSSQTISIDSRLCLHYLSTLTALKAVIIDISYISLSFDLDDSPENWRNYFYYRYFGISSPSIDLTDPRSYSYSALYTKGFINDLFFNQLHYKKEFGDIQPNGWEKTGIPEDSSNLSYESARKRVQLHQSLSLEKNIHGIRKNLEALLKELAERKIKIFFVTPPVYKTYSFYLDPRKVSKNQQSVRFLCESFPAAYFDYSQDPRFHREDFYDNDHLNALGAKKFTQILNHDFISGICN